MAFIGGVARFRAILAYDRTPPDIVIPLTIFPASLTLLAADIVIPLIISPASLTLLATGFAMQALSCRMTSRVRYLWCSLCVLPMWRVWNSCMNCSLYMFLIPVPLLPLHSFLRSPVLPSGDHCLQLHTRKRGCCFRRSRSICNRGVTKPTRLYVPPTRSHK